MSPAGKLGAAFGVQIEEAGELTMRDLVKRAGGNPDEWESAVVFVGSKRDQTAELVVCSRAALEKLFEALPVQGLPA